MTTSFTVSHYLLSRSLSQCPSSFVTTTTTTATPGKGPPPLHHPSRDASSEWDDDKPPSTRLYLTSTTYPHSLLYSNLTDAASSYAARQLPRILTAERPVIQTAHLDKIFSALWLDEHRVLMGTKCNRLVLLLLSSGRRVEIPSISSQMRPISAPDATPSLSLVSSPFPSTLSDQSLVPTSRIPINTNPSSSSSSDSPSVTWPALLPLPVTDRKPSGGIYALALNSSHTLLAIGSGMAHQYIQILSLPSFDPIAILEGHSDVVFSLVWISDHLLLSGSRDTTIKMWNLAGASTVIRQSLPVTPSSIPASKTCQTWSDQLVLRLSPVSSCPAHDAKVRAMSYDPIQSQASSLGGDGYLKLWDIQQLGNSGSLCNDRPITSIPLFHTNEVVCLDIHPVHHLHAVGSQHHVTLIDPRANSIVHTFASVDEGWGVRSLLMGREDVVTIGGGMGRISFYDLRAHRYLNWADSESDGLADSVSSFSASLQSSAFTPNYATSRDQYSDGGRGEASSPVRRMTPQSLKTHLEMGTGWLCKNELYHTLFSGIRVRNAVYTLAYDHSGTRLFAAGGPLQLNLTGSYAGLFQ